MGVPPLPPHTVVDCKGELRKPTGYVPLKDKKELVVYEHPSPLNPQSHDKLFSSSKSKKGVVDGDLASVYDNIKKHTAVQHNIYEKSILPKLETEKLMYITEPILTKSAAASTTSCTTSYTNSTTNGNGSGLRVSVQQKSATLSEMEEYLLSIGFLLDKQRGRIKYILPSTSTPPPPPLTNDTSSTTPTPESATSTSGSKANGRSFEPLRLSYDICYIRHGKTEGNTEPRIYQGQVDYVNNFLNDIGRAQAEEAAVLLKDLRARETRGDTESESKAKLSGNDPHSTNSVHGERSEATVWVPDVVFSSPLTRALQTASPLHRVYPSVEACVVDGLKEMAFGPWDNVLVRDVPIDNIIHLFYLEQNVLVKDIYHNHIVKYDGNSKHSGKHATGSSENVSEYNEYHNTELPPLGGCCYHRDFPYGKEEIQSENFVEVMCRARATLLALNEHPLLTTTKETDTKRGEKTGMRKKVLMYGHSMSGAAISILLGHGKTDEYGYLGFDGHYIMPNATPTLLLPKRPMDECSQL